jgi:hypothetical protein
MKEFKDVETKVPEGLTYEDVMNQAGTGPLTEDQFLVLAGNSMRLAAESAGGSEEKCDVFSTELKKACSIFGDPINHGYLVVIDYKSWANWYIGLDLHFNQKGSDGLQYTAIVWRS